MDHNIYSYYMTHIDHGPENISISNMIVPRIISQYAHF